MRRYHLIRTLAIAAATVTLSLGVLAEESREVTLRMKGGGFQVTGEIRSFDGTKYVVESAQLGKLTLQAARFECVGAACNAPATAAAWTYEPLSPDRHETVVMRGSELIAHQLMPALVRGYAASAGLSVVQVIGNDPRETRFRLVDARGKELAVIAIAQDDTVAGLVAVERDQASIAMTDRAASKEETDALVAAGPKIKTAQNEHLLGVDGLAVIVAPDNPVSSLSIDVIAKIFSGQIADWYELGLPPGKIRLIVREGASEAADRFHAVALKPRNAKLSDGIERVAGEAELADTVTRDRNAIGLVSLAFQRSAKLVPIESSCGLIQRPTPFALKTGEYPLGHKLYLYSAAPPKQAAARGLLRFAVSPEAQSIISDHQIASSAVEAVALADQSERMAHALNAQGEAFDLPQMRQMLADLKGARRLSITFRFLPGTLDLDRASQAEVTRLAALLQTPEFAGKKIVLAGFTDANGAKFQANFTHAYKRSNQVRTALLAASAQKLDYRLLNVKGYGPLAPVACNDAEGARLNRRVEVWAQ